MKNILFGIILLAASNYSTAQNDTIYEENYRVLADMLFSNLDSSIYGPNLLNRSFSTSEEVMRQLKGDYSQTQSVVEFLECYQAISYSYLDTTFMMNVDSAARFIENEFAVNEQNSIIDELILPFGLVVHSMSYIDSTKANATYFSFANNNLFPLVPENEIYRYKLIKSAAVLEFYPDNGYETGKLKYTKGLISHSPDISNLNLMINVGNGYEFFNEQNNFISFSRLKDSLIGSLAISYKKGNSIYFDTLPFYVVTDANNKSEKRISPTWNEERTYTHWGITYQAGILWGCNNGSGNFKRPIIIVPPYRPTVQSFSMKSYFLQFDIGYMMNSLAELGYDVIFLRQEPGNVSLEIAGLGLAGVINMVNEQKLANFPNEHWENCIIGYSMGGQVARFALKLMEKEHMEGRKPHHHTRLYIPFDSPHLGANIPMFTQAVYSDLRNLNVIANMAYNALTDEASKDMSVAHIAGSPFVETGNLSDGKVFLITPSPRLERVNFVSMLTNSFNHQFTPVNDLRKSYPTFSRNVAVSTGRNDQNYDTEFDLYPGRLLFNQPGVIGNGLGGMYAKTRRFYSSLYGPESTIFRNKEQFLFMGFIPITTKNREYRTAYAAEWDMAQGGYKDDFFRGAGTGAIFMLRLGAFGIGYNEYQDGKHISFLPLVSALGINPTIWSPNNLFYNVKEEGLMFNQFNSNVKSETFGYPNLGNFSNHFNVTPFEAVYCDPQTYEHIKMIETFIENDGYNPAYLFAVRDFILDEVEADVVYLQNKIIGLNHTQSDLDFRYKAWYKANDQLIIGSEVTPKTDIGPYIIQKSGVIDVSACNEVILSSGFETQLGSDFHAHISCDGCSRLRSSEVGVNFNSDENTNSGAEKVMVDLNTSEKAIGAIVVYPNPSNGEITISINGELKNAHFEVYDLLGNKINSGLLDRGKTTINLKMEKGFFILRILNNGDIFIKKIQRI